MPRHRYGDLVVHERLKFAVAANEFVCICGPSGCGKTTLLDMLAGILKPSQGTVLIDGSTGRPEAAKHLVRVPGAVHVPLADVRDNVATGLRIKGSAQRRHPR